jgi:hypothetical protein
MRTSSIAFAAATCIAAAATPHRKTLLVVFIMLSFQLVLSKVYHFKPP